MDRLMLLGVLSLIQMGILPGLLIMRLARVPRGGLIQDAVYCAALSLIANHSLILVLVALGLYTQPVLMVIFAAEGIATLWAYRSNLARPLSASTARIAEAMDRSLGAVEAIVGTSRRRDPAFWLGSLLLLGVGAYYSADSLLWLLRVFRNNVGDIFREWDAVVNWNVWATMWARGEIPNSFQYPQLIPANWSLTYVFMGNTQIQFFAALIMPLFAILVLLLLLDLAIANRRVGFLLALVATRYMTKKFLGGLIDDGYVDIAILFFFFLPLHALMKATSQDDAAQRRRYAVLGGVFAAGAALTKQSGLYIFALWPVLTYALGCYQQGERNRPRELRSLAGTLGVASLIALPWYVWSLASVALGTNVSSVELMQELPLYSMPLLERLRNAVVTLGKYNVLFLFSLAALPLLERRMRWILLGVGIPSALIWAVFLSYDTRNLAPVIPVISLTAGMGLEAIATWMEPAAARLRLSRIPQLLVIGTGIAGLLAWSASVPDRELLDRQDTLLRQLWYAGLNEQIYARAEQVPGGLFLTNYRMDFLPGLADVTLVDHLRDWGTYTDLVNGNPEIRTVLLSRNVNEQIVEDVRLGVEEGRYGLIVEMGDWIMVDVPRSPQGE